MSRSGYGEMGRFALRSMISNPGIDLYLHNIDWGKTGWIWEDDDERRLIDSLLQKTVMYRQNGGTFDASVQCTIPNEWQKITDHDVGYTAGIEVDRVSPVWLEKGNEMSKIIVISNHSKNVYTNTSYDAQNRKTGEEIKGYKCTTPIEVVGFPKKDIEPTEIDIKPRHDFNFFCVAHLGPRKNIDAVIDNFIEEFKNEEVGIIFKVNGMNDSILDFHNLKGMFRQIKTDIKEQGLKCSINLLHGNLTDEQMHGLYKHPKVKAMVSLTHGEGFGLPLYEAAYSGMPVIATNWSGHLDFLKVPKKGKGKPSIMFAPVKYDLTEVPQEAVWDGVINAGTRWATVDSASARKQLRNVYKNYSRWEKKASKLMTSFKGSAHYYKLFIDALGIEFKPVDEGAFSL